MSSRKKLKMVVSNIDMAAWVAARAEELTKSAATGVFFFRERPARLASGDAAAHAWLDR